MTRRSTPGLSFGHGDASPRARGYRMPAEWEPHTTTWLVWPHNRADFEVKTAAVDWCYAEIVRHLVVGERVAILFHDTQVERRAVRVLEKSGIDLRSVDRCRIRTNRSWVRDAGPIFVVRRGAIDPVAATDWRFNGWARYRAWQDDNALPRRLSRRLRIPRFEVRLRGAPVVLEGGSVDVNGEGLLLTTEECLLSPIQARNPGVSRQELEYVFHEALGVRRVMWLSGGIAGDDTHGHVDNVARFVNPTTVVVVTERDRSDENYETLRENRNRLTRMTDLRGRSLTIVPLPMPQPISFEGRRLPASYANFYIANRRVLVPTFNDPSDRIALTRLARLFPDRQVVGIHAVDLLLGLGTVHCLTQQQPA